jgi:Dockerin type I domain
LVSSKHLLSWIVLVVTASLTAAAAADSPTLRIASYNIDSQDQGSDNNITQSTGSTAHSISTVIQAIGNHHIGSNAQPVDVLGLEEMLTSTIGGVNTTLNDLTTQLNNIYGAGTYSFNTANPTQSEGLIYNTKTVQIVGVRALRTGSNVVLQSNGTFTAAHQVTGTINVPRAPMVYQLRPVGFGANADFYMYVSHAIDGSDNSSGDGRYAEAQEVRSDAKYNLPVGAHIMYSGDWNLFNGSGENAYKCLTGQVTSDGINWADSSSVWANSKPTQGFDPTSKTSPPTTSTFQNSTSDGSATYLYNDSTNPGTFTNSSRLDIQLVNSPMLNQPGLQLASDRSDPFEARNFPSSQYPYAFEVFGNNGSTPRGGVATSPSNNSLQDLANASTVLGDLQQFGSGSTSTGSDHYPVVGDYTFLYPGDFNRDGHVTAADILPMIRALADLSDYESMTGITDPTVLHFIEDVNGDGNVTSADLQALLDLLISGGGSVSAVPEPASLVLLALTLPGLVFAVVRRRSSKLACCLEWRE